MSAGTEVASISQKLDRIIAALQCNNKNGMVDTMLKTTFSSNMIEKYLEDIESAFAEAYKIVNRNTNIEVLKNDLNDLHRKMTFKQLLYRNVDTSGTCEHNPLTEFINTLEKLISENSSLFDFSAL